MIFIVLTFLLVFPNFSEASILRLLSPGGPISAVLSSESNSENDFDLQHPLSLLREDKRYFILTTEYEDIFHLKKNSVLVNSFLSSKKKVFFLYPFNINKSAKNRFILGFDRFGSSSKAFSCDKIEETLLHFRGHGSSISLAKQFRNLQVGYFINKSISRGIGFSREVYKHISMLDYDSETVVNLSGNKTGFQIGYNFNENLGLSFLKGNYKAKFELSLYDLDDHFRFPFTNKINYYEIELSSQNYNNNFSFYYRFGKGDSLNKFEYNSSPTFGTNILNSEYRAKGFNIGKNISSKNKIYVGFERYRGQISGAGVIEIPGSFFDLIGGYYLYHHDSQIKANKFKIGIERKETRKMTYRFGYQFINSRLDIHFDGGQKFLFGFKTENQTVEDEKISPLKLHKLGIGFERKIGKDKSLLYSIVQLVPQIEKRKKIIEPIPIKKQPRGGTLHIIAICFSF